MLLRLVARAGSLRRFLLVWQLGWLWLMVVAVLAWQAAGSLANRAAAQDARLQQGLEDVRHMVATTAPQALPDAAVAWMARSGMQLKVVDPQGEWIAGRRDWQTGDGQSPQALAMAQAPRSFTTQYAGVLLRGLRAGVPGSPVPGEIQVALPLAERLPAWTDLHAGAPAWLLGLVVASTGATVSGIWLALAWLRATSEALASESASDPDAHGPDASPRALPPLPIPAELARAASRLQQAAERQRAWVDAQNRFVADASHQLRTPLAVLRSQLQALQNHELPVEQALPRLLHTLDHATDVANRFLGMSKLEQVRREGRLATVSLQPLVCDVVVALGPLIGAKRLQFALDGPDADVAGDAPMLGELLSNLLANAIHHTPPAGRLGVLVRDIGGQPELVIWDEGGGLDDAERANRFQPFVPSHGGGGLGLSICNQIAQAMGATLRLHNRIAAGEVVGVDAILTWHAPEVKVES